MHSECPKDFWQRANILYDNGFGFQPMPNTTIKHMIGVCTHDDIDTNIVNEIRQLTGSNTLNYGYCIGEHYLEIEWYEHNKIPAILKAMLNKNQEFKVMNKLNARFYPGIDNQFTYEIMERKGIQVYKDILEANKKIIHANFIFNDILFDIWNWKTNEGKEFCNFINEKRGTVTPDYNHENNYYNWDLFKNCDLNTLLTKESAVPIDKQEIKIEEEAEEEVCMICLANTPDTLVLPCEHCVVCKPCSIKLRNTNDKKICVRCRRNITYILE